MGRPKEHSEETRGRLLDTASRLLGDEGPSALSIRRLADEVGSTTRAIYSLFGSKEGLLSALYREGADTFVRLADAVPREEDPLEELPSLAMAYRASALAHPNLSGLLFERAVPGFSPSEDDREHLRGSLYRVFDAVQRGVNRGRFPGRDPWALTNEMWAIVHGLASLELQGCLGPPEVAEASWRSVITTMASGLTEPLASGSRG
jgi:AcrR family transcriptional regulator